MATTKRGSGVLCHLTCLPSEFGIGDLGPCSYKFVDLLSESAQSYWNILPLGPTNLRYGNSPYQPDSTFAGNTLLISPELLCEDGFIEKNHLKEVAVQDSTLIDFPAVTRLKRKILDKAFKTFNETNLLAGKFEEFCDENAAWIEDYALYKVLVKKEGRPWFLWPKPLRDRSENALVKEEDCCAVEIQREKFEQFLFFEQWTKLKKYSLQKNLQIIGDLPFYVSYESADIWVNPELFKLDVNKKPLFISGVPPDYFSKHGQIWGNPVYMWQKRSDGTINWWMNRIAHALKYLDILRLDHFRGLISTWQIPVSERNAEKGRWVRASSNCFFKSLAILFPRLPFVAEDLGVITPKVREAMSRLNLPGMRVLLFAFGSSRGNPHLPENHDENAVAFTGTHDTNTVRGWFVEEATSTQKEELFRIVGKRFHEVEASWELIKLAQRSRARLCIIPMQDLLSLGSEARMNYPTRKGHNWEWRMIPKQLVSECFQELGNISKDTSR